MPQNHCFIAFYGHRRRRDSNPDTLKLSSLYKRTYDFQKMNYDKNYDKDFLDYNDLLRGIKNPLL